MTGTIALLFFLSGLFGGYSLLPRQFYYVSDLMSWSAAQSYCQEKYTELVFVYSEDDLNKLKASGTFSLFLYRNVWIGGYDMNSDTQNITETANTTSQISYCLTLDVNSFKKVKKDCAATFPFYCSRSEGKRVVLQMQLKPVGQVNMQDPVIRANMLAKINYEFNNLGLGNAVKIRWLTRREPQRKNSENDTCTFFDPL